jgi:predicted NACHT family NTPase
VRAVVNSLHGDEHHVHKLWAAAKEASLPAPLQEELEQAFFETYRQQLLVLSSPLNLPTFGGKRMATHDDLFVRPRLSQVGLMVESQSDEALPHPTNYIEILTNGTNALVLGDAGAGKSVLVDSFVRALATDSSARIPFRVRVRELVLRAQEQSVVEFLEQQLRTLYQCQPPSGTVTRLLSQGRAVVIFDGLDEAGGATVRSQIISILELFRSRYPYTQVIVTSRPSGVDQTLLGRAMLTVYRLEPFTKSQIQEFALRWFSHLSESEAGGGGGGLVNAIEHDTMISALASNPLMLALMCILYERSGNIPRRRAVFFEKASELLLERWDTSRGVGTPDLDLRDMESVLQYVAYRRLEDSATVVTGEELITEIADYLGRNRYADPPVARRVARQFLEYCQQRAGMLVETGMTRDGERLYGFAHLVFLEYFAAGYLAKVSKTPQSLASTIASNLSHLFWQEVGLTAIQIEDRRWEDGAAETVTALLEHYSQLPQENRTDLADFLGECVRTYRLPAPLESQIKVLVTTD